MIWAGNSYSGYLSDTECSMHWDGIGGCVTFMALSYGHDMKFGIIPRWWTLAFE